MLFIFKGEKLSYDEESLLAAEARLIKKRLGMAPFEWMEALEKADVDAIQGLVFLAKKRMGLVVRWEDFAEFDLLKDFEQLADPDVDPDADPDEEAAGGGTGDRSEPRERVPDPT